LLLHVFSAIVSNPVKNRVYSSVIATSAFRNTKKTHSRTKKYNDY
jgi:hypothetical protein